MLLQTAQTATAPPLTAYVGNYEYENGPTVDIIANKTTLYAVLDEAKYVLTRENGDSFRNGTRRRVAWHRYVKGEVDGFQ